VGHVIRRGTGADIEDLRPLWVSMVEHHREVSGRTWPVRAAEDAWVRRRAQYREWLTDGTGTLFLSADTDTGGLIGYAMVQVHEPGATWDLGAHVGELESLAVIPAARGAGVGSDLIAACRAELRSRAIEYWLVAVVEVNEGAVRLYEREGFRPYYRNLLGRVDSDGTA
jgi:ribosomal protein S18 acetylase RimI-like enzyme